MKLYFDRRLRRFVTVPGLDGTLETLTFKAGDVEEVVVQFGQSPDGAAPNSVVSAPTWTAENLGAGALIDIGIKASGDYSDGDLLAGTSTYVHDSAAKTYTFNLSLNTTEINNALERADADDTNDIASLDDCLFELTYKHSAGADYQSSIDDITVTIKHDILSGSEGTPVNAADPDEYSLISNTIEFLDTVTSQTGGTSADLDSVSTVSRALGSVVAFLDGDSSSALRIYSLDAGTDAEAAPDIIRPDDYSASTNEKVWRLRTLASGSDDIINLTQLGSGNLTAGTYTKRTLVENSDPGGHCSVSSGVFNLATGTYRVEGSAAGNGVGQHVLRIRNTTTSADVVTGMQSVANPAPPKTQDITCVADSAGSLDGTEFYIFDEHGGIQVWIDVDNDGTTAPGTLLSRSIEVTGVSTGDTATDVATAVATAINSHASFSASASSGVVTVTHVDTHSMYPAYDNDTGFTFSVTEQRGVPQETRADIRGRFTVTSATDNYELQHLGRFSGGQGGDFLLSILGFTAFLQLTKES